MKVLHVIPSLSPSDGGPSFVMPLIARGLRSAGVAVDVATTVGDKEAATLDGDLPGPATQDGVNYFYFRRQAEFYKVSRPMTRWLARHMRDYDLVHIHALFSYATSTASNLAIKNRVPYVIRPLGVLNRWGMENRRRLLKQFSFRFVERRILTNAAAIHYTSRQEKLEAEQAGVTTLPVVIPLGVDTSAFQTEASSAPFYTRFPHAEGRQIILFLSRLDPKKGLDILLRAYAEVYRANPASLLVIAGDGEARFVESLKALAAELGIAEHVLWAGFLGAGDKMAAFRAASLFALPSYSENFGLAGVEALASGLACVVSDQVGIAPDIEEFEAGSVVPCEVAPLASAIQRLLADARLRERAAENAVRLANERFSIEAMTRSLIKLYSNVVDQRRAAVGALAMGVE
jgi:glycosyltransferase involved in cell wall biosynthesis